MIFLLSPFFPFFYCFSVLFLFFSMLPFNFICTLSVFLFSVGSPFLYTTPVTFHSFLSPTFCVHSFFIIIIMFSFLSMCLCQFIWLSHCIILTFYCISFLFVLFCCSNFSLFSLLFLYIATIFSQSFSFSTNRL